jgi:type 1 glutamine amidotransferase
MGRSFLRGATFLLSALAAAFPARAGDGPELFRPRPRNVDALRVLLVTGGHDHDVSFYSVLDGYDDLAVRVDPHPNALRSGEWQAGKAIDVVALYDMPDVMAPQQEASLTRFVESGGGIVVLHHAIAGRTGWRWWWEEVVGGRYLPVPEGGSPASRYAHDQDLLVEVAVAHPVTAGLDRFRILDETYKGMWISPRVQVLLRTAHPGSDGPVVWIGPHPKARVVAIQLGHGREAHLHPAYRRLVASAVRWAGRRGGNTAGR